MRIHGILVSLAIVLLSGSAALAETTPNPDSVKALWDFYNNGWTNQVVVGEFKACLEVDTERTSETAFECTQTAKGTVEPGTRLYAWLAYLMPRGSQTEDVMVQLSHNGIVRTTRDLTLKGKFLRNRAYTSFSLSKAGEWEIVVLQGNAVLARASVTVQ